MWLIGLLTGVIARSHDLTLVTVVWVPKLLMPSHVIGAMTPTGGAPPSVLVPTLLKHARVTKAKGTLIILQWFSAPFWFLIFPDGINPAEFVKGIKELPRVEGLFLDGCSRCNLFKGVPNTPVLALCLSWQISD